jgi:RNA polymerase sigma-B factor
MEDLSQIGSIGLLKAIDKFDPERGTNLMAFAIPVIMGEIKNYFRDHGWAVKIPRKVQRQKLAVDRAVERLSLEQGRSPTVREIANATGFTEEEVYDTLEVGKYGHLLSLDAEYEQDGAGEGSTVLDYLGQDDPQFEAAVDRMDMANILGGLKEREKTIIRLKFYGGLSQTEIAGRLGISQMHVSRLQRAALDKLRRSLGVGAG